MITGDMWLVPTDSWPTFDIDPEEFLAMLDQFDDYWPGAVASLAETPEPGQP